jgi:hypothetical protein
VVLCERACGVGAFVIGSGGDDESDMYPGRAVPSYFVGTSQACLKCRYN